MRARVRRGRRHALAGAVAVSAFACFGCATTAHSAPPGDDGPNGSSGGGSSGAMLSLGADGSIATFVSPCSPCTDFPAAPIVDTGAPANAASMFGSATSGATSGGPCLEEPEVGALFPNNWLRPRFKVVGAGTENLFEIRLHVKGETNDLVVYTTSASSAHDATWTMPKDMWTQLAGHIRDVPITVTVRGLDSTASSPMPALGSSGTFTIAPVSADGAMVYWATTMAFDQGTMNTQLKGFHVGEDSVVSALQTAQVQMKVRATWGSSLKDQTTQVQCIGCHTSTPDGQNAAFTAQWPWPNAMASVEATTVGQTPAYLSAAAQSNLSPNINGAYGTGDVQKYMLGIETFSKAHFSSGDRIVVTTQGSSWYRAGPNDTGSSTGIVAKLMWFDLETTSMTSGTGFGEIARTGDSNSAAAPSWSHDGNNVVYASTDTGAEDGRMGTGASDLVVVPYNDRKGGTAAKVPGASDSAYCEYYPAYSADDSLIAFNRIPSGKSMYIQPAAEVYVIRAAGGTAARLKANDPVSCLGTTSPGVQNTWPKWSPTSTTYGGKTYHFLIFSSKRAGSTAQLYATAVVDDGTTITTYPSIYLWNQDATLNNEIPAWDVFQIPTSPIQ